MNTQSKGGNSPHFVVQMMIWLLATLALNALTYYWNQDQTIRVELVEIRKDLQAMSNDMRRFEERLMRLEQQAYLGVIEAPVQRTVPPAFTLDFEGYNHGYQE